MAQLPQPDHLQRIWDPHRAFLRRLLIGLSGDLELAEDLLQDTYLRARAGFAGYRGGEPRAWLASVAKTAYWAHLRRRPHAWEQEQLMEEMDGAPGPGSESHLKSLSMSQALAGLSPELRRALMMRHYAGLSYQEIAQRMGSPVGTAKWRVSAAIGRLRLLLEGQSGTACQAVSRASILDLLYQAGAPPELAALQRHLEHCTRCQTSAQEARCVMHSLDLVAGERKMMHLLELDRRGRVRLYLTMSHRNDRAAPQRTIRFYITIPARLLQWTAQGDPLPYRRWRDPHQPRVVNFAARLPVPIAPGKRVQHHAVFGLGSETSAERLGDGSWRLRWVQRPSTEVEYAFVQAIRLPPRAMLLQVKPEPREVRVREELTTLLWATVLPAGQAFTCTVEYRLGG